MPNTQDLYLIKRLECSIAMSVVCCICILLVYLLLIYFEIELDVFGDKTLVLLPIFIGLPVGAIIGNYMAMKRVPINKTLNINNILLSYVLGIIFVIIGVFLMDIVGIAMIVLIPFLVSFGCVAGDIIGDKIFNKAA